MSKKFIISALLACSALCGQAQLWSLEQCIDYAIEHNIDIQQQKLSIESEKISLNTAKMSRLPNLNGSAGYGYNFGRTIDSDNQSVESNGRSGNVGLSSSIPVFTGFRINNEIKGKSLDLAAATEELNRAKENLSLTIMRYYLQVLFQKELQKIAQEQVRLTNEQVMQSELMVKSGKRSMSDLYDSRAQLAKDEVSLTEANNNVKLALLDLNQLLNLSADISFDIVTPNISGNVVSDINELPSATYVYNNYVEVRPAIKAAEYKIESSKRSLAISRSALYPTLSLGGSYSNSYYYLNNLGGMNQGFRTQIKNNASEYVGLSMSIPIFNRFATRNQIRQSKLNISSMKLKLENEKQNLFKEIQQAYTSAVASHDTYISAQKSVEASKLAFQYEETKFKNGRSTSFELSNSRTLLQKAQAQEAQALFDYVFRSKILDFYQGKSLLLN